MTRESCMAGIPCSVCRKSPPSHSTPPLTQPGEGLGGSCKILAGELLTPSRRGHLVWRLTAVATHSCIHYTQLHKATLESAAVVPEEPQYRQPLCLQRCRPVQWGRGGDNRGLELTEKGEQEPFRELRS